MSPANYDKQWLELEEKVMFLKESSSYPGSKGSVDAIETHLSWVFLTNSHAYKMKKPVKLPFLDFSTLEARRLSTNNELKANTPLAPGVYLEVIPLVRDKNRRLHLAPGAQHADIREWLLKMKRLPRDLMLDRALTADNLQQELLFQAAQKLAAFYRSTHRVSITPRAYLDELNDRVVKNFHVLSARRYGLDLAQVEAVHGTQILRLQMYAALLKQRVRDGHIVDGHGDLKAEHICLTRPPVIIDRLETASIRYLDPVDELSFLWIECRILGRSEAADIFFDTYRAVTGDDYPAELPPLFKSLNACTRARFAAWHLDDPRVCDKEKWHSRTAAYFQLAREL